MSPVSRTRKVKKSKAASGPLSAKRHRGYDTLTGPPRSALAAMQALLLGPRQRPEWFDFSIKAVLDGAGVIMAARGPRELEQATAELLALSCTASSMRNARGCGSTGGSRSSRRPRRPGSGRRWRAGTAGRSHCGDCCTA